MGAYGCGAPGPDATLQSKYPKPNHKNNSLVIFFFRKLIEWLGDSSDVEKCDDHPKNIAVELCKECSRYICGIHDDGLCKNHNEEALTISAKFTMGFFIVFFLTISVIMGALMANILNKLNSASEVQQGDVVTVDGEPVTVTETFPVEEATNLVTIFFSISIPIFIIISIYLFKTMRDAMEESEGSENKSDKKVTRFSTKFEVSQSSKDNRMFFCQRCGGELKYNYHECPECGKDISDEKDLIF